MFVDEINKFSLLEGSFLPSADTEMRRPNDMGDTAKTLSIS